LHAYCLRLVHFLGSAHRLLVWSRSRNDRRISRSMIYEYFTIARTKFSHFIFTNGFPVTDRFTPLWASDCLITNSRLQLSSHSELTKPTQRPAQ
jgi:hypothetical protein